MTPTILRPLAPTSPGVAHAEQEITELAAPPPAWNLTPSDLLVLRQLAHPDSEYRSRRTVVLVYSMYILHTGLFAAMALVLLLTNYSDAFHPAVLVAIGLLLLPSALSLLSSLEAEVRVPHQRRRSDRILSRLPVDGDLPVPRSALPEEDRLIFDGLSSRIDIYTLAEPQGQQALRTLYEFAKTASGSTN